MDGAMAPRHRLEEVILTISFGPAATPFLHRAATIARDRADEFAEPEPGVYRARFTLARDELAYASAQQVLGMVMGWRATVVELDGVPEQVGVVRQMLACARGWLADPGACRAVFPLHLPAKCRRCPLYEPEWALESHATPTWLDAGGWEVRIEFPDRPEDEGPA
jgi:hypothetical protein